MLPRVYVGTDSWPLPGVLGNTSTYTDAEEPEGRAARMDKADNSWFSVCVF